MKTDQTVGETIETNVFIREDKRDYGEISRLYTGDNRRRIGKAVLRAKTSKSSIDESTKIIDDRADVASKPQERPNAKINQHVVCAVLVRSDISFTKRARSV